APEYPSGPTLAPPAPPPGGYPAYPVYPPPPGPALPNEELYNRGVVVTPGPAVVAPQPYGPALPPTGGPLGPAPGGPDWVRTWLGSFSNPPQRCLFQSDHCFDNFISPITNPFLFEDPRALTEIRPIFIQQGSPSSQYIFHGGSEQFLGTQLRV